MSRRGAVAVGLLCLAAGACAPEPAERDTAARAEFPAPRPGGSGSAWPSWGGPRGDFVVADEGLAEAWDPAGPPLLWSRPLGAGYSAIVGGRGALYTMYRDGGEEATIALRADDGRTIWERRRRVPMLEGNVPEYGEGPNATPLLLGDRVVTLGYNGRLDCRDAVSGEPLWSWDLIADLGAAVLYFGFTGSPVAWRDRVVVLVGGEAQGLVAFDAADGEIVWKSPASTAGNATPLVLEIGGREQIVYFSQEAVHGVDAETGAALWSRPVINAERNNCTMPLRGPDDTLFVTSEGEAGARLLELASEGDGIAVRERWFTRAFSVFYWNALRVDDHVYASIGTQGTLFAALDLRSGRVVWRERGFTAVNQIRAGERTLLLDHDGLLALVDPTPAGLRVLAEARILDGPAFSVPTLIGTTLYVRDGRTIRALDLGPPA